MDDLPDFVDFYLKNEVPVALGRVTIAWNTVSHSVFMLYNALTGLDEETAKATFFCVNSDRSQRDMVTELVKHKLKPLDKKLGKRALKLIADINEIAGKRNDFMHVVFLDHQAANTVKQFHPRNHLKNKEGRELIELMHALTMQSLDIAVAIMKVSSDTYTILNQRSPFAAALLGNISPIGSEESANHGEFGLLTGFVSTPPSSETAQD